MRYAILSDIHANLEAFEAVISFLQDKQIDQYRLLGDFINFGADPQAVVQRALQITPDCLMGQQEAALFDAHVMNTLNPSARFTLQWTQQQLTHETLQKIQTFPLAKEEESSLFVHASPLNPGAFFHVISQNEAQNVFSSFHQPVCFVGHTHVASLYMQGAKEAQLLKPGKVILKRNRKTIVNVGSVGQPLDWDWRASVVIFDDSDFSIEALRVEYDRESAARKIREAHLPEYLAERFVVVA